MAIAYDGRSVPEAPDRRIAALAARQHGVFARAQALAVGMTEGMIGRRLAGGRWERPYAGVYRIAGAPKTWRQALLAACVAWGPGAVASHRAAAALWGLAGRAPGPPEITVPRGRDRSVPGTIVHRPLVLERVDVVTRDAIPVTTPARTLLDMAAIESADQVEEALDDALARRLVSLSRLRWRLDGTARRGRPGVARLRRLLEARAGAPSVPQSVFETRLLRLLARSGLPAPAIQHRVRRAGRVVAVVDLAYPDCRVAIEAEGYRWHGGRRRWERDLARRNELTGLGWRVVHVTWTDMEVHPERVAEAVRRARRAARPRR